METPDLVVTSRRVVLPDRVGPAAVLIRRGVIDAVVAPDAAPRGCPRLDAGDKAVLPGIVDTHA